MGKIIKKNNIWREVSLADVDWQDFFGRESTDESDILLERITEDTESPVTQEESEAQKENQAVLKEAELEARQIVERAKNDSETVKEEAFSKGLEEGKAEAERQAEEKYQELYDEDIKKIRSLAEQITVSFSEAVKKAQSSLVKLALDVAKKVIKDECRSRKEVVVNMIKEGLSRVSERAEVKIKVNPAQLPSVKKARETFLAGLEGIENFKIVSDSNIEIGGCIIDTTSGSIDLRVEKQFSEIKKNLVGEGENE